MQLSPSETSSVDPLQLSAVELARAIAQQRLSASAVVERFIQRIEEVDPDLNAIVFKRYDAARREAREADQRVRAGGPLPPLLGVPITLKECIDLAGSPSTFGIDGRSAPVQADAAVVSRIRDAGAIVLAKTNVSQLLSFVEAANPVFGRTNHPLSKERSCGGSSGGEGAIVAMRGSPLGFGTDVGGSIRVPAASCGLVGFKPTAGRCLDVGRVAMPPTQQTITSQIGVLARHVDDVALGLRVAIGSGDDRRGPLAALDEIAIGSLRFVVHEDDGFLMPCPAARRALREAIAYLTGLGAEVVQVALPDRQRVQHLFLRILSCEKLAHIRRSLGGSRMDLGIQQMVQVAGAPSWLIASILRLSGRKKALQQVRSFGDGSADQYFQAAEQLEALRAQALAAMSGADIVLSPAMPLPALRHGATQELSTLGSYTTYWNALGWPAGVVPITTVRADEESDRPASRDPFERTARETERGSAGLPIAVQIAAAPHQDHIALAALRALEQASQE
ncbi:MAG TPA: amidase family protein [Polyangiales bacterium]|nr:amidase family protein [Polyangiales bacterium]